MTEINRETILTSPDFVGLTTATPVQIAKCRIKAGEPLGDLATHPDVIAMLGGDCAAQLPTTRPAQIVDISASRTGKTLDGIVGAIEATFAVDVSGTSVGDIIRYHVAALTLAGTRPFMSHLISHCLSKPALRSLLVGEPTYELVRLRHRSGRVIEVTPVPIDRAGGSALSVYSAGVFIDEYPRMVGRADGVKNVEDFEDALHGRMLPGAQIVKVGSPWAPFGPAFDAVQKHWGRPSADLVVLRTTGRAANPSWWSEERCTALARRNPLAYRADCLAEFVDAETGLISATDYDDAARESPLELRPEDCRGRQTYWAIDPSGRVNSFTLIGGVRQPLNGEHVLRVILTREWAPRSRGLDIEAIFFEISKIMKSYGAHVLYSDGFSYDSNKAHARRFGIALKKVDISTANKLEMYTALANAIASGRFEPSPDPLLRSDILSIRRRVTQSGATIDLPTTGDGRHADLAAVAALLNHVADGRQHPMLAALRRAAGRFTHDPDRPPPTNEERLAALRKMREEQDRPAEPPPASMMLAAASSYDGRLALYHRYDLLGPLYSRPPGYRDPAAEGEALAALAMRARRRF